MFGRGTSTTSAIESFSDSYHPLFPQLRDFRLQKLEQPGEYPLCMRPHRRTHVGGAARVWESVGTTPGCGTGPQGLLGDVDEHLPHPV